MFRFFGLAFVARQREALEVAWSEMSGIKWGGGVFSKYMAFLLENLPKQCPSRSGRRAGGGGRSS